jgi:hypothetical protein
MKYIRRVSVLLFCCLLLSACHTGETYVSVEKEGTEYIADNVHFYYPNRYTIGEQTDKILQLQDETEVLFYEAREDETINELTDRDELYVAELEMGGASNFSVSMPILDSGLTVYEITGSYIDQEERFKHIVYFTEGYTYVYGYQGTIEDYEENIVEMTMFLKSIVVEER